MKKTYMKPESVEVVFSAKVNLLGGSSCTSDSCSNVDDIGTGGD